MVLVGGGNPLARYLLPPFRLKGEGVSLSLPSTSPLKLRGVRGVMKRGVMT